MTWSRRARRGLRWTLGVGCLLAVGVVTGCESRVSLGGRCATVAECAAPLACVGGRCREACTGPDGCPPGLRCVAGPSGLRACSLVEEEACIGSEPCDPSLFVECREGRCVTGCSDGSSCVSGSCDTSSGAGVCIEPVSTGRDDAGPLDAGPVLDAGPTPDAGLTLDAGRACLPRATASMRSLAEALFGSGSASRDEVSVWIEAPGAAALDLAARGVNFDLAVRAGGVGGPRLLTAVNLGPHEVGEEEISIHRTELFATPPVIARGTELAAATGFGAISGHSEAEAMSLAILRPMPMVGDETDDFAWIVREDGTLVNLETGPTPSRFPGYLALFGGPDVDFARELLLVDELAPGGHQLALVGAPFGLENAVTFPLTAGWGDAPYALSTIRGAALLHEPTSGRTLFLRCPRAEGTRPALSVVGLGDVASDAPLVLASLGEGPAVIGLASVCDELPVARLECEGMLCDLAAPGFALEAPNELAQLESTPWGELSVIMVRHADGASVLVLERSGSVIEDTLSIATTETYGLETLSLREAHVAASVSGDSAVLVLAGLYGDGRLGGRLLARAIRLSR